MAALDVRFADFDPEQYSPGAKYAFNLFVPDSTLKVPVPVLLARGAAGGNRLVALAGIHGDEFEGVQALFEVFSQIETASMTGDFLGVPVAHPAAFWNGTRVSPLDGADLARSFPGNLNSGPTAILAYYLGHFIIERATLLLDLHSGGLRLCMPTFVGYDATDQASVEAAHHFGASTLWGHPSIGPGRTISFAASKGIPWLYTEARGAGRVHPDDLTTFVRGISNLLRYLKILPGDIAPSQPTYHLYGDASLECAVTATEAGFFSTNLKPLDRVATGEQVGVTCDLHGNPVEVFTATSSGVLGFVRQFPVVQAGDCLFLVVADVRGDRY